jgi:NAD(P)-dependent dehydrogenase (short-subunit alcohol dehydrogenase family)
MRIDSKTAIVTGGGGEGSGGAISRRLAREGAAVVVADVNDHRGREIVREIESQNGRAAYFRADVGNEAEVRALFAFAEETYSGVDIVVNDASLIDQGEPLESWFETLQVDLIGTMLCVRHGIEAMRRRRGGAVVNISSTSALGHGRKPAPWPAYDVAKAGVIRLTTSLASLQKREGIRVNCLVPDWVATPEVLSFVATLSEKDRRQWGVPEVLTTVDEVAGIVVRLIEDETLAGRIVVWWCGQPPQLIPREDPGYSALESYKA